MKSLLLLLFALMTLPIASAQDAPSAPPPVAGLVGIEGVQPAGAPPPPELVDDVARDIASQLRCPVCQGLSIADSQTETAIAMFDRITELVRLGYDEDQIDQYFIDRYGDWVLLAPRAQGLAVLLWVAPVILVIGIVLTMLWLTRRQRPKPVSQAAPTVEQDPDNPNDPYTERILRDLESM